MKVAIVTMLEKNYNYGATLQAYALAKYLNQQGYRCEVLRVQHYVDKIETTNTIAKKVKKRIAKSANGRTDLKTALWNTYGKIKGEYGQEIVRKAEVNNEILFEKFVEQYIPCSQLYNAQNVCCANEIYDVFICGSDQIWKPECTNGTYFLDFCELNKGKIAYAPSIARNVLNREEVKYYKEKLATFKAQNIAIREKRGAELIEEILGKPIAVVLDPTFLLDPAEWIALAKKKHRIVEERYCLSYFLSPNCDATKRIGKVVHQRGLKLVNISYGIEKGYYQHCKSDFALEKVGPIEFLNLLLYADVIYTDSFHGVVFSIIFNKNFKVLDRRIHGNNEQMTSRLDTLLELAKAEECRIENKDIEKATDDRMQMYYSNLEEKIDFSKCFLKRCLSVLG